MSDAGSLVTKLKTLIEGAVSGVTVSTEAISSESFVPESYPYCIVLQTGYEPEVLEWQQERRTWTFTGVLFTDGESDTRETIQTHLEAIRDAVAADPTLTGSVDTATTRVAAADDNPDSPIHAGDFEIAASAVV